MKGKDGHTGLPSPFLVRLGELEKSYLRETDPVRQSGFGGGNERWRAERELILDAVSGDGDFLDAGCANGYLLECLTQWGSERGVRLTPYGVDISAAFIGLAKERLPRYAAHFHTANAWEWHPPQRYPYVYSLHDCVPGGLFTEYVQRLLDRYVAPGGTLIIGAYGSRSKQEAARDIARDLAAAGFRVTGFSERGDLPLARIAWIRTEPDGET